MSECSHPYESVTEVKVDAMLERNNIPLNRTSADICKACGSVIGSNGRSGFVMELLAQTGCDHPHESIEEGAVILTPVGDTDTVLGRKETGVCTECNQPANLERFEL